MWKINGLISRPSPTVTAHLFSDRIYKKCHCWQINRYVHNFWIILLSYLYDVFTLHSSNITWKQLSFSTIWQMWEVQNNLWKMCLSHKMGSTQDQEQENKIIYYPINHLTVFYMRTHPLIIYCISLQLPNIHTEANDSICTAMMGLQTTLVCPRYWFSSSHCTHWVNSRIFETVQHWLWLLKMQSQSCSHNEIQIHFLA